MQHMVRMRRSRKRGKANHLQPHQHNKNKVKIHSFPLLRWKAFATGMESKATDHPPTGTKTNSMINGPSINYWTYSIQKCDVRAIADSEQSSWGYLNFILINKVNLNHLKPSFKLKGYQLSRSAAQQWRQALRWGYGFCLIVKHLLTNSVIQHWWLILFFNLII